MALQPATRRLLTEAAAATAYQPKGSYQPAGSYLTTAQLGAASGVASLGSDGKVLPAQLPAGAVVLAKTKTAPTSRANAAALTDDPDLVLTNVPAGNYVLDGLLRTDAPAGGFRIMLGWGAPGYDGGFQVMTPPSLTGTVTASTASYWQLAGANAAVNPTVSVTTGNISLLSGALYLPAAQSKVSLMWCQSSSNATATVLNAGSYLRLTKAA
jgi:hypothetical protein